MNRYAELLNWLNEDIRVSAVNKVNIQYVKEKLRLFLHKVENNNKYFLLREKIKETLELSGNFFFESLNDVFFLAFFSKETFMKKEEFLKEVSYEEEMKLKLKHFDSPLTHAFLISLKKSEKFSSQLERASSVATAALTLYYDILQKQVYPPEYKYFFSASLVTTKKNDVLSSAESFYIIVMYNNFAYMLPVIINNIIVSFSELKDALKQIVNDGNCRKFDRYFITPGMFSASKKTIRVSLKSCLQSAHGEFFNCIENAIFILCLDRQQYSNKKHEEMFSIFYKNRCYLNTQFVIGSNGEAGIIANYFKVEGKPALEIANLIFQRENALEINKNSNHINLQFKNIPLLPSKYYADQCIAFIEGILHDKKSEYPFFLSIDFFKSLKISPSITINLMIMLAIYEIKGFFPVLNHAVARTNRNINFGGGLDWLYYSPSVLYRNYQTLRAELHRNNFLESFFEVMHSHEKKIKISQEEFSPTFFISMEEASILSDLAELFVSIGKDVPAYRNYLFRVYRNTHSIDIMTSTLKLPLNVEALGRYGTCTDVLSLFGLHILLKENQISLVFIPNKNFLPLIDTFIEKLNSIALSLFG